MWPALGGEGTMLPARLDLGSEGTMLPARLDLGSEGTMLPTRLAYGGELLNHTDQYTPIFCNI